MTKNIAEILTVGDEILSGVIVNTNAAWLGQRLTRAGWEVRFMSTVRDDPRELTSALKRANSRAEVVIITGGLGPTPDDLTQSVAVKFFNTGILFRQDLMDALEARYQARGWHMPAVNRNQAEVPADAELMPNPVGSAQGLIFEKEGTRFFFMPGVPAEMKAMADQELLPRLEKMDGNTRLVSRILRTTGAGESALYEKVADFKNEFPQVRLAFLPQVSGVQIRLAVPGLLFEPALEILQAADDFISSRLSPWLYGRDDDTLEGVVADVLTRHTKTLAVAESCTGGLISYMLTRIPGSSRFLDRSIVTYSNVAKSEGLSIPAETIDTHGAVSAEVASKMAENVRKMSGVDIGLSVTGIAGPGGGSPEKPVGLTFIGLCDEAGVTVERFRFHRDREWNRQRAAYTALNLLRRALPSDSRLKKEK